MDEPLTHREFDDWHMREFRPHQQKEDAWELRISAMERSMHGDPATGHPGVVAQLGQLVETSVRIDNWLDGIARVWKIVGSVVMVAGAFFALGRNSGWW